MKSCVWLLSMLLFAACGTVSRDDSVPYSEPNQLMGEEIQNRISKIPYQHRAELFDNLVWLAEAGEQAIPALLQGLKHSEPKVRSSCAYVLGRLNDRRTIPNLQEAARDSNETVRMEVSRTLVLMGDMRNAPELIRGLDSDRPHVRFYCHEALKVATGRDFGFDHLTDDEQSRRSAVLQWRQWWAQQSGDQFFAREYATQHQLNGTTPAAPGVESREPKNMPLEPLQDSQDSTSSQRRKD